MKKIGIEFFAERGSFGYGIMLHARVDGAVAQPVVFEAAPEGVITPPMIEINTQSAQRLMDELWQCGIRPTEGHGSTGQAAAMQSHLSDLRTIAFKVLKIDKGGEV